MVDVIIDGKQIANTELIDYKISDLEDGDTSYFGFLKSTGEWYIMKLTSTEARYVFGVSDYSTIWTGRASLTYSYYDGE